MPTTWTIAVDWDRNDNYSGTYDNVTDRVMEARWFLGTRTPYTVVAEESTLDLTLTNPDRRFSPENSASPLAGKLLPQRPVRVQSHDGTTTRTHWMGWIEAIKPTVGTYGAADIDRCAPKVGASIPKTIPL